MENTLKIKSIPAYEAICTCGSKFTFNLDKPTVYRQNAMKCPNCDVVFTLKISIFQYLKMRYNPPVIKLFPQKQDTRIKDMTYCL